MKWSIHQLRKHRGDRVPLDQVIDLKSIIQRDDSIRAIGPIRLTGYAEIEKDCIDLQIHIEGEVTVPCARTWEDAAWSFALDTFERFSWEEDLLQRDETIHPVEQNTVDVRTILEDLIIVSIPLQVYAEGAEDLTYKEGKGWTYMLAEEPEEAIEEEQKVDPRLAALAKLLQSDEE